MSKERMRACLCEPWCERRNGRILGGLPTRGVDLIGIWPQRLAGAPPCALLRRAVRRNPRGRSAKDNYYFVMLAMRFADNVASPDLVSQSASA